MKISTKYRPVVIVFATFCASAVIVRSQHQVNPQVQRQVNTALYATGSKSSVRYAKDLGTSVAMPSELRYAYVRSGALPSEIRMNVARIGPLSPGGPLSYIPDSTPSYMPQRNKQPPPSPMGSAAYYGTSVRFASPKYSGSSQAMKFNTSTGSISPKFASQKVSSSLVPSPKFASPSMSNSSIRYNR